MIDPKYVSAVIVTRGDVDLGPCLKPILAAGIEEIIIRRGIGGVVQRYQAALSATFEAIYTQDDDCVVNVKAVLAEYDPRFVTCNMPQDRRADYQDGIALLGWGATFHQDLVPDRWPAEIPMPLMRREADRWFTGLNPLKLIDVPFEHLPWAHGADRMGQEANHLSDLREIRKRIYAARDRAFAARGPA